MKLLKLFSLLLVSIVLYQCTSTKELNTIDPESEDTYDLVIFDPAFTSWLTSQPSIDTYAYAFLKAKNTMFVSEYNNRVSNRQSYKADLYPQRIDYYPNVEYDKEFQFKLYNYFLYFQKKYKQRL